MRAWRHRLGGLGVRESPPSVQCKNAHVQNAEGICVEREEMLLRRHMLRLGDIGGGLVNLHTDTVRCVLIYT